MSHDDHIHQYSQHKHPFQLLEGHGSLPGIPQEQRRAVLWRRRMKLQFEMQGLFIVARNSTNSCIGSALTFTYAC